jgi:hypothetical protein
MFVSLGVRRSHRRALLGRWDERLNEQNVTAMDDQTVIFEQHHTHLRAVARLPG